MQRIFCEGTVSELSGDTALVAIGGRSGCHGCAAEGRCGGVRTSSVRVPAPSAQQSGLSVGQKVVVSIPHGSAMTALWWAFVLPLVVMVAVLATVQLLMHDAVAAACSALAALAVYYLVLWTQRRRFAERYTLSIKTR